MAKITEYQYTYKKQIGFTKQQKESFGIMRKYDININQFIRQAVKEKLHREWKSIITKKDRIKDAPSWLYDTI